MIQFSNARGRFDSSCSTVSSEYDPMRFLNSGDRSYLESRIRSPHGCPLPNSSSSLSSRIGNSVHNTVRRRLFENIYGSESNVWTNMVTAQQSTNHTANSTNNSKCSPLPYSKLFAIQAQLQRLYDSSSINHQNLHSFDSSIADGVFSMNNHQQRPSNCSDILSTRSQSARFNGPHIRKMCCVFCKNNNRPVEQYTSHSVRDPVTGYTTCPVLRRYVCPNCGTRDGPNFAHTKSYCPLQRKIRFLQQQQEILNRKNQSIGQEIGDLSSETSREQTSDWVAIFWKTSSSKTIRLILSKYTYPKFLVRIWIP